MNTRTSWTIWAKRGAYDRSLAFCVLEALYHRIPVGMGMSSTETNLNSIMENRTAQMIRAMPNAHSAFHHSRGVLGAEGSVPGTTVPSSRCDRTPTGSNMKNASHQLIEITISDPAIPISQTCSSSIKVPLKSFGCMKMTGFPCAPILGCPSPVIVAPLASI